MWLCEGGLRALPERIQAEPVIIAGGDLRGILSWRHLHLRVLPALKSHFSGEIGICVQSTDTSSDFLPRINICLETCSRNLPRDLRGYRMRR